MTHTLDPLYLIKKQPDSVGAAGPSNSQGRLAINNPSLMRERSIKTNRRHKFISALTRDDADICTSRISSTSACSIDLQCSGDPKVSLERYASRLATGCVANIAGKSLDICAQCCSSDVTRATYPCRLTSVHQPLLENERNTPPWWNLRLREEGRGSTNKSGTRSRLMCRGPVLGCSCGCKQRHNG